MNHFFARTLLYYRVCNSDGIKYMTPPMINPKASKNGPKGMLFKMLNPT